MCCLQQLHWQKQLRALEPEKPASYSTRAEASACISFDLTKVSRRERLKNMFATGRGQTMIYI